MQDASVVSIPQDGIVKNKGTMRLRQGKVCHDWDDIIAETMTLCVLYSWQSAQASAQRLYVQAWVLSTHTAVAGALIGTLPCSQMSHAASARFRRACVRHSRDQ